MDVFRIGILFSGTLIRKKNHSIPVTTFALPRTIVLYVPKWSTPICIDEQISYVLPIAYHKINVYVHTYYICARISCFVTGMPWCLVYMLNLYLD